MQFDYKNKHKNKQSSKSKKPEKKDPTGKKTDVLERLVNNNNDFAEEQAINVTDNLQITFEHGKKLYNEL